MGVTGLDVGRFFRPDFEMTCSCGKKMIVVSNEAGEWRPILPMWTRVGDRGWNCGEAGHFQIKAEVIPHAIRP